MSPALVLIGSTILMVAPASTVDIDRAGCTVERITGETVTGSAPHDTTSAAAKAGSASARIAARGPGAVRASSSSSQDHAGTRSVATTTDAQSRTVTTIREQGRCTIIINERVVRGGMQ